MSKRGRNPLRLRQLSTKGVVRSPNTTHTSGGKLFRPSSVDSTVEGSKPLHAKALGSSHNADVHSRHARVRVYQVLTENKRSELSGRSRHESQMSRMHRDARVNKLIAEQHEKEARRATKDKLIAERERRRQELREAREAARTRQTKLTRIPG